MPTVLRSAGFALRVYTDDHTPPHVHVIKAGKVVIIELDPVRIIRVQGMRDADIVKAVRLVEAHAEMLSTAWREIHGNV